MTSSGDTCDRHPSAAALTWWWLLPSLPPLDSDPLTAPELTLCGNCAHLFGAALRRAGFTLARDHRDEMRALWARRWR